MTLLAKLAEYQNSSILANRAGDFLTGNLNAAGELLGLNKVDNALTVPDLNKNSTVVPVGSGIIDVVNDFPWNANYINTSYDKIPKIYLTEREQQESSMLATYYYYISSILNIVGGTQIGGASIGASVEYLITKVQELANRAAAGAENALQSATNGSITLQGSDNFGIGSFVKFVTSVASDFSNLAAQDKALLGEYLKSYTGIYLTRETGFKYVFPYFSNQFIQQNNSWSNSQNPAAFFDIFDAAAEAVTQFVSPGVYIERPKYFDFQQSEGDSITIRFPLLNTVGITYRKNYEFLWLLAFQNKYYRTSFASVRPPKIYTLQIPGVRYMPYAYISNLNVDFMGTRRLLDVETPAGPVRAPIPDAYMVEITITSLLSNSANLLLSDQFHKEIRTGVR